MIDHARIQKPGLALVGHMHGVVATRIQILGETELSFLSTLDPDTRRARVAAFFAHGFSLVVVTAQDDDVLAELGLAAEATATPLALSAQRSSHTIAALHTLLDDRLAPRTVVHGVLVDVFGLGLLLLGKSGIGKSECALELVMRGHRLVADDAVHCDWRPPGVVVGAPAELLKDHIEARGLGVLNVRKLYGVTAARDKKQIHLVVRLLEWSNDAEYDRLGVDDHHHEILDVRIREVALPVRPGRNMASIIEIAARNELMRQSGVHSSREFMTSLERAQLVQEADRDLPSDDSAVLPATVPTTPPGPPR
ncbi:MAG: HPr(Ser) kinase/phosphatase [Polyangiaceae bacterium]|nr:HPr(Ser) kinase/phosphatase [Polyangiaceae bacterium]